MERWPSILTVQLSFQGVFVSVEVIGQLSVDVVASQIDDVVALVDVILASVR
jgi:hypothetical protein